MFHLKNYVFFVRNKNMKIPWDEKFIPSHPVGLDLHPIPSHGIFQKNESSHGMGWDCPIPFGALISIYRGVTLSLNYISKLIQGKCFYLFLLLFPKI
jgi:hypothetical protein